MTELDRVKVFILTDERCGGTTFVGIFTYVFNLTTVQDPQTNTTKRFKNWESYISHKEHHVTNILTYCYQELKCHVVKCCYVSFSFIEYTDLIDYCQQKNIKMVVLHRENIFDRALSLAVADKLNNFGIKDVTKIRPYNLDLEQYENNIIEYINKYKKIISYLVDKKYDFFHITYDQIYKNENKLEKLYRLFNYLSLDRKNGNYYELMRLLDLDYHTKEVNRFILNMNEVKEINKNYFEKMEQINKAHL